MIDAQSNSNGKNIERNFKVPASFPKTDPFVFSRLYAESDTTSR